MPLNERYLDTQEVINLTRHFLKTKTAAGHFTECKSYSQVSYKFGDSAVIVIAKRPAGQPPVIFACDGKPEGEGAPTISQSLTPSLASISKVSSSDSVQSNFSNQLVPGL